MPKRVQRIRHANAEAQLFKGLDGEISVNSTNKSIHIHDDLTVGGFESARMDLTTSPQASTSADGKMSAAQATELGSATSGVANNAASILAINTRDDNQDVAITSNQDQITINNSDINTLFGDNGIQDARLDVLEQPAIAGFAKSNVEYTLSGPSLAVYSPPVAQVDNVWESVGATGQGQQNTWTALDSLPIDTKWIEVLIAQSVSGNVNALQAYLAFRMIGSGANINDHILSGINQQVFGNGNSYMQHDTFVIARFPIFGANRSFELHYRLINGTFTTCNMQLQAFGV